MKKKSKYIVILLLSLRGLLFAQTPNFSEDIATIFYKKCTSCHRDGGIAPFKLETYNDAVIHSSSIKTAVSNRTMPPWPPDQNYKRYAHERLLTQSEINLIVDWVNNDAPQGDPMLAPSFPVYPIGSVIGIPDLKLTIPTYTVTDSSDVYRCFVIPSGLSQTKYLRAIDVIPGNRKIVHHVLIFQDNTGSCKILDDLDPLPGYTNFGGVGSASAILIGGWVPGSEPSVLPQGMGTKLSANADIVLQVHYAERSVGESDSTSVNLFYTPSNTGIREVHFVPVLNHFTSLTNGPLFIPANTVKSFDAEYTVPFTVSAVSVAPHMHLLGQSIACYVVTPTNDTIHMIKIDDWDFHWQGSYAFQKVTKIPAGSRLYAHATYDNTSANPENPNSPPKNVSVGESTTDEMMLVFFQYLLYQPGDENIIMDSTLLYQEPPLIENGTILSCYPNPSNGQTTLFFYLLKKSYVTLSVYDRSGKVITKIKDNEIMDAGYHSVQYANNTLAPGMYFFSLETQNSKAIQKFVVVH